MPTRHPKEAESVPTGLTKDAGWQIGVSRTLPLPVTAVWDYLMSPGGVARWLGPGARLPARPGEPYRTDAGAEGELRSLRPYDRVRLTLGSTVVQVTVSPAPSAAGAGERTVLRFHQDHMSGAPERERRRAHWRAVMDEVAGELEEAPEPEPGTEQVRQSGQG
jgi:uncharacterized protein YndB with AHSA1/START domain